MSYCRWADSDWYVFWSARDGSHGANALLCVWYITDEQRPAITYEQALSAVAPSIIGGGADDMTADNLAALIPGAPREAIPEVIPHVLAWMRDVEREATCAKCGRFVAVVRDERTQDVSQDHSALPCEPIDATASAANCGPAVNAVRKFLDAGRAAGHDALGVANDPEWPDGAG